MGGVSVPSYVQPADAVSTSINVLLLYQRRFISFALQSACKFDVPEYVSSGAYLQSAVDALGVISGSANAPDTTNIVDKMLNNSLPVCVCVCVCVGFCGFQRIRRFLLYFLSSFSLI